MSPAPSTRYFTNFLEAALSSQKEAALSSQKASSPTGTRTSEFQKVEKLTEV